MSLRFPAIPPCVGVAAQSLSTKPSSCDYAAPLTDDTLPEVVGLTLRGRVTGELPVDLVVDIRHRDKCSDDSGPATSLHCTQRSGGEIVHI